MSLALEQLDAEVQKLADEATPELLVRLLRAFLSDDRPGLLGCERHMQYLFPYVRAQIDLTRAKRSFYRWDDAHWPHRSAEGSLVRLGPEERYRQATITRDNIRQIYRSKPCTCWVPHR